jgi:AAHS family benzoate transporter-like MFS transporter/AAHS family 4-hydroxybenzoate transporter-like MFS transporter
MVIRKLSFHNKCHYLTLVHAECQFKRHAIIGPTSTARQERYAVIMDIEAELRGARLSWFHYRLALVLGCVLFIDGYDLFNAGYIAPYIRQEWALTDRQVGTMLSIGIAGLAIGAYLQAPVSRWIGRRLAMAAGTTLLGVASLSMATWVNDFSTFAGVRLVLGISLGMLSPIAFVYVNEWAPAATQNRFATVSFVLPFSLGGIAAGAAAMTLGPVFGWRGLYFMAVLALPIAVACFFLLPESLVRLLKQQRRDTIRRYLDAVRPDRREVYAHTETFSLPEPTLGTIGLGPLFRRPYRWTTLGIWSASALSLLCLHGISGWLPTLLITNHQAFASAFGFGTLLMTMQIVGGTVSGVFADRYGRTGVMIVGFLGSAVAMLVMGVALGSGGLAIGVAAAGFFIFGTQAVMNNFTAMSYEPALRATGTGAAVAFSRVGGVLGPILIAWTRTLGVGLWITFALLAATQVAAAAIVAALRYRRTSNERFS